MSGSSLSLSRLCAGESWGYFRAVRELRPVHAEDLALRKGEVTSAELTEACEAVAIALAS